MTTHSIKMLAPCGDCIHANVCAIKAVLDAEKATLTVPAIQWVTPRFDSMLVDCSEFIDVLNVKAPAKRRNPHGRLPSIGQIQRRKPARPRKVPAVPTVLENAKAAAKVADEAWAPLCMPAADFEAWGEFNRKAGLTNRADRPCDDCPASYAAEMAEKGMCNGIPGVAA